MRLAAAILALSAAPAMAHGDASSLARGGYLDPQAMLCCGPVDCEVAPASLQVSPSREGVTVNGTLLPWERGAYFSTDGQVWWCRHLHPPIAGKAHCVFVPPRPGS